jgi:hypothetical protein
METSGWDIALSVSTVVLAVATVVLAVAAVWAARIAVDELRAKTALADADVRRRRAEGSHQALLRFMEFYDTNHAELLSAARAVTKEREDAHTDSSTTVKRCRISELLGEDFLGSGKTSEEALNAIQNCLDRLEEIAVGVELGVYDPYVLYHGASSRIRQLIEWSGPYIAFSRKGKIPHRDPQPTAFTNVMRLDKRLSDIENAGAPTKLAGALEDGLK